MLGYSPGYDDLNWNGLEYSREDFSQLMEVDLEQLVAECEEQKAYFERIGQAVPAVFEDFRQGTIDRAQGVSA